MALVVKRGSGHDALLQAYRRVLLKAHPDKEYCEIVILRKNGSDGVVKVDYTTVPLGETEHTAPDGVDYISKSGTLQFNHGETEKTI